MTPEELIAFEDEVARRFEDKTILAPVHLAGGNELELINLFHNIDRNDWVFTTYRSHYHALLHGIPKEWVMAEIMAGRSMYMMSEKYRFFSSAIVGGMLSIATGVAAGLRTAKSPSQVWCFLGDMAATGGAFAEAERYAIGRRLPITYIIEDNSMSCDTPTIEAWGSGGKPKTLRYYYTRTRPHINTGKWVQF